MTKNTNTAPTIVLTDAAAALILTDVRAGRAAGIRYGKYVAEMGVTLDTLPAHVAEFRNAYKAEFPKDSGDRVKAYATKVRNGLRYHLTTEDSDETEETPKNLLTAAGIAATLEEVTAAWKSAQK